MIFCRRQSGHETDSQKIDRLSVQLETMQSMLQELLYQKQGKKSCCISQEKRPLSNILNQFKGDKNGKQINKTEPDAGRGIKSVADVGGIVAGGVNFGGFKSPSNIGNKLAKIKETSA